jgi:hypothetical protein
MRRTLGTLFTALALAVTAGCGDSSSTATDPAAGSTSGNAGSPSRTPGSTVDGAQVLPLISMTGAGGQPQQTASELNTQADVDAFARQFRAPSVVARLRRAAEDAQKPGYDVVGQIVMVGCDHPPGADVVANGEGGVVIVPREVASPLEECLAAVTTVAIARIPAS